MMRARWRFALALFLIGGYSTFGSTRVSGAEPLDDRLGVPTPLLFLLMRSDFQQEVGLEPAQVAEVKRFTAVLYGKALRLKGQTGPGAVEARRAIDAAQSEWMSSHLTPEQRERLSQVDLQWEGVSALLSRPVVADYLGLTSEQQAHVARVYSDSKKLHDARKPWTYEEHVEMTRKAIAALSEHQRHLWARVLGRPCRFVIEAAPPGSAPPAGGQTVRSGGRG
jgi:hypothetical protein